MKNFKAILVDDEEYSRSSLYFLIQDNCPELDVVNISKSVKEASAYINDHEVDLVFLDIAMPQENGFALIPLLKEKQIMVIFTTAFDQYALRAIKASAVDYLLKPIDISDLKLAVDKAHEILKTRNITEKYYAYEKNLSALEENLSDSKEIKKITISSSFGLKIIKISNIVYLEADSNYCIFHLVNGEKITASKTLKEFEDILIENDFYRIHKSYIINTAYLKEYKSSDGFQVKLINDIVLNVSRRRVSEFLEAMKSYNITDS